jgi:hypothetical protein
MNIKELLQNFCDDYGFDPRFDYSGRCMYNKKCFGVVCSDPLETIELLCDYIRDNYEDCDSARDILGSPRMDSMGLDQILYFPSLNVED